MVRFPPEPGEYDGKPVPQEKPWIVGQFLDHDTDEGPQEDTPTRYVLRAMTLEDAHKQGFSTKWFDERAKTRDAHVRALTEIVDTSRGTQYAIDNLVSWPTGDGV